MLSMKLNRVCIGKAMRPACLLIGLLVSGCFSSIEGGPPRLFSIAEESDIARVRLAKGEDAYYVSPAAQNKAVRNEIIAQRMRAIDSYYYAFEASLIRERQEVGFISSIISIGLSGAVPLVSPVTTKNILGAASSGLQGATKAYSDEVLFQKTVQVLATQMRAHRDAVASNIITRMKTLDIDQYPLAMALGDVDEYYAAGTIAGALIEIQKTVSAESESRAEQKAQAVIRGGFGFDDNARILTAYLLPGGEPDEGRIRRINACLGGGVNVMPHLAARTNARSIEIRRRAAVCARQQSDFS
jgi:hypothetical protein